MSILQNGKEESWAEKLPWLGMCLPTTGEVTQYAWENPNLARHIDLTPLTLQ